MFPEIHLWCYTCWPLSSHAGCQADLFHIPAKALVGVERETSRSMSERSTDWAMLARLMAYFHQRRRIWTRLSVWMVCLIDTLYYAEIFPLVWIRIRIPVWRFSLMATVPILGQISVLGIRIHLRWWKWATRPVQTCSFGDLPAWEFLWWWATEADTVSNGRYASYWNAFLFAIYRSMFQWQDLLLPRYQQVPTFSVYQVEFDQTRKTFEWEVDHVHRKWLCHIMSCSIPIAKKRDLRMRSRPCA